MTLSKKFNIVRKTEFGPVFIDFNGTDNFWMRTLDGEDFIVSGVKIRGSTYFTLCPSGDWMKQDFDFHRADNDFEPCSMKAREKILRLLIELKTEILNNPYLVKQAKLCAINQKIDLFEKEKKECEDKINLILDDLDGLKKDRDSLEEA